MLKHRNVCRTSWQLVALFTVSLFLPALAQAQAARVTVGQAIQHDTSASMANMTAVEVTPTGETKQVPLMERQGVGRYPDLAAPDGGLQSESSRASQLSPTPSVMVSASGLSDDLNATTIGGRIVPPDVNGDIGLDQNGNRIYIQYINLIWGVYNESGSLIAGPFAGNSFWNGFGGPCEVNNDGDPIVLYDDQAGRWVFSQFSIGEGIQCMAISTTSNPLGPYHRYAFEVTPGRQNDYPKLGVWDDGTTSSSGQSAYTFTTRDFPSQASSFMGTGVMERDQMLVGGPAQFIKYENACVNNECIEGQLPPHLAGSPPPAGTCPTFWTAVDAAYDDSPHPQDGYRNHKLCVDWSNLANSTFTEGSLVVAGSNFDRFLGNISPVLGGENLNSLPYFTMYRAQYRWFGNNASVLLNTTVDAGSERAGIRWAETRSVNGDSNWFLAQDGTYAPADGLERWMGSIAQDGDGNIALGYTVAGTNLFPSVRYTTRMAGDAAGTMAGGEASCIEGTGAQTGSSNRWGDYSSMSIDPTDDCTFWYTQEYYQTTGSFDFNTRICSFKLADCGAPVLCTVNADCDNGSYCDGAETCNTGTGACEAGASVNCDNGLFCDGTETCNEGTDSCDNGTPPNGDDGVACTIDTCNEGTDSFTHTPDNALCDNGVYCDGAETCDVVNDCQAGIDPCPTEVCDELNDICAGAGCGDNLCDIGENCNSCAEDCISGSLPGASCGNGLCEASDGENGVNCSADCNAKLGGKPSGRFSCGFNDGYAPDGCGDPLCTSGGFACTTTPVDAGSYCCGDLTCEGAEDSSSCAVDCGAVPFCGDGTCDTGLENQCSCAADCGPPPGSEAGLCGDGIDNDCGGGTDCSDSDCSSDPICNAVCEPSGASCSANADCCSNKCKGKPGSQTCS